MLGGPHLNFERVLLCWSFSLLLINRPPGGCTPVPPCYPAASRAPAASPRHVGSLEAPLLESVFGGTVKEQGGDRVEEGGRG